MKLLPHERVDDLQIGGLSVIQDTRGFCFGTDAVLLSSFPDIREGDKVFDMCTGCGIVAILLSAKTQADKIYAMEIIPETAEMAKRSVQMNNLKNVIVTEGDIKEASSVFGRGFFDVITCNPPYKKAHSGLLCADKNKTAARHEVLCTLEDVLEQSAALLKPGGRLYMVHRPERLCDIMYLMRKYKIEPKRLRFVHSVPEKAPMLLLIEGISDSGEFLKILPPLYIYDENKILTKEVESIYNITKEAP